MTAATAAATDATARPGAGGPAGYLHGVSWRERLLDVLRVRVPRALCGASLVADPDLPVTGPGAPPCPRCLFLAGGPGRYVPGHWARYVTR